MDGNEYAWKMSVFLLLRRSSDIRNNEAIYKWW